MIFQMHCFLYGLFLMIFVVFSHIQKIQQCTNHSPRKNCKG